MGRASAPSLYVQSGTTPEYTKVTEIDPNVLEFARTVQSTLAYTNLDKVQVCSHTFPISTLVASLQFSASASLDLYEQTVAEFPEKTDLLKRLKACDEALLAALPQLQAIAAEAHDIAEQLAAYVEELERQGVN